MERLPREMVGLILLWNVRMCRADKNTILPLRLVCRAFNAALKPYVFKTIQIEYSRLLRAKSGALELDPIAGIGDLASAVYIDMMVVRDEEEICRLNEVFHGITSRVPEMNTLIESLRKYCMNESTFDAADFRHVVSSIVDATPNMNRLKLNLPFQVVGRASQTSTLLLANTLACIAKRPEEFKRVETLVLDHVSDKTVNNIFNNHIDISNAFKTFECLKNLVISIKRQEYRHSKQVAFTNNFWMLIRKACHLESLCIIGWNVKRNALTRKHHPGDTVDSTEWSMRSLPYPSDPKAPGLRHLRYLELKRVDIDPEAFCNLISENCHSLKEIYLNEVYLKVRTALVMQGRSTALWIGHPGVTKCENCIWIAQSLRNMEGLNLEVLRATGIGYDDFEPAPNSTFPNYDLTDHTPLHRSFDERFVTSALGIDDICMSTPSSPPSPPLPSFPPPIPTSSSSPEDKTLPIISAPPTQPPTPKLLSYDAETFQRYHNTTSQYKRCIDGIFYNHNEQALRELQRIITVADRGMSLISAEIDRTHEQRVGDLRGIGGSAG